MQRDRLTKIYGKLTKRDLQVLCEERQLECWGVKKELVARLVEHEVGGASGKEYEDDEDKSTKSDDDVVVEEAIGEQTAYTHGRRSSGELAFANNESATYEPFYAGDQSADEASVGADVESDGKDPAYDRDEMSAGQHLASVQDNDDDEEKEEEVLGQDLTRAMNPHTPQPIISTLSDLAAAIGTTIASSASNTTSVQVTETTVNKRTVTQRMRKEPGVGRRFYLAARSVVEGYMMCDNYDEDEDEIVMTDEQEHTNSRKVRVTFKKNEGKRGGGEVGVDYMAGESNEEGSDDGELDEEGDEDE